MSLTFTSKGWEIGFYCSVVEGLNLTVDVLKGLVVVIPKRSLNLQNLQTA